VRSIVIASPNLDGQQGSWKLWMKRNARTSSVSPATGSIVSPLSFGISRDWIASISIKEKNGEKNMPVVQEMADVSTVG
jgi:hypothetical protein